MRRVFERVEPDATDPLRDQALDDRGRRGTSRIGYTNGHWREVPYSGTQGGRPTGTPASCHRAPNGTSFWHGIAWRGRTALIQPGDHDAYSSTWIAPLCCSRTCIVLCFPRFHRGANDLS